MSSKKYSPQQLQELVTRRNKYLQKAFSGFSDRIRIIGHPEKPAIIYEEKIVMSVFVKNFDLKFTSKPFNGEIVKSFKLTPTFILDREFVLSHLQNCSHRFIYKIQFLNSSLFLAGYNFRDKEKQEGKYPVFARHNPKLYFTEKKAIEVIDELKNLHYNVNLV
ncbi:MAG TPA: hypothetical protein ENH06_00015 [bacterium]|nr:hypothetical protein [bacterium]